MYRARSLYQAQRKAAMHVQSAWRTIQEKRAYDVLKIQVRTGQGGEGRACSKGGKVGREARTIRTIDRYVPYTQELKNRDDTEK